MTVTFSVYGPNDNAGDPVIIIGPKDLTFRTDLASTASGKGAALVGFRQAGTGATDRTALVKMRENVSIYDFMSTAQISAAQAGSSSADMASVFALARDAAGVGGTVTVKPGV